MNNRLASSRVHLTCINDNAHILYVSKKTIVDFKTIHNGAITHFLYLRTTNSF